MIREAVFADRDDNGNVMRLVWDTATSQVYVEIVHKGTVLASSLRIPRSEFSSKIRELGALT